ncbi:MAG: vault protein inter-alpha-trypsin protein [Pedosphaera sp.]|nr:vault protein inter-alpha-trypsin protein [Pedosphaera sp.]
MGSVQSIMKRWILLVLVLAGWLITGSLAGAAGVIIIDNPEIIPPRPMPLPRPEPWPRPYPQPRRWHEPRPYAFAPLEVNSLKAHTRITDQVAVTKIDQEFYNPNPQRLEGTFVFPIPKGAQLDKFSMEIDGKPVQAELLAAEKARGIYEDIVRKMKDPALMEYAGQDVLKLRIYPIEPNSKKRISLSYTQVLKADGGLLNYVLPMNAGKYSSKPIKSVSVKVEVESKRPLKSIYSPSHAVEVNREGANRATAGYEASEEKPDADFQLYFAPEKDEIGLNLMTYKASGEDGYFLLLASPGVDVKQKQIVAKDVVFVLDTSGSMAGNKLNQAKKALQFCVENLNEGDRFEIVRFSTEVEPLFNDLVAVTKENKTKANEFIKGLKPIGATAIDDALKKALELASKREERTFEVIFLTDGMPTIGVTDEKEIVSGVKERNKAKRRIFCFGIGTDVNTHLLDKIAEETRGFSQYVLPEEDIEVKVSSFFSKINEPVLANPTLKFTADVRTSKMYPSPLPDLFKGEQLVLVGRYSGKGSSAAVIEGKVNGEKKKFSYDVNFPEEASEHDFIPRLWATRRVGYLLDEIRLHGENGELKDEVTELARKYGIVTPYTAYLIVEDESKRGVAAGAQSLRRLGEDAEALDAVHQGYDRLKKDVNGEGAVYGSRSGGSLKLANTAATGIQAGKSESENALGIPTQRYGAGGLQGPGNAPYARAPMSIAATRAAEYTEQTQFVGGKNFFQNGEVWVDSEVQKLKDAKKERVKFGSPEYFALSKKHPEAAAWLALGTQVQFVLGQTVYEVYE